MGVNEYDHSFWASGIIIIYAADISDCGCYESNGHEHVRHCFAEDVNDEVAVLGSMGFGCSIFIEITEQAVAKDEEGESLPEIRESIGQTYSGERRWSNTNPHTRRVSTEKHSRQEVIAFSEDKNVYILYFQRKSLENDIGYFADLGLWYGGSSSHRKDLFQFGLCPLKDKTAAEFFTRNESFILKKKSSYLLRKIGE